MATWHLPRKPYLVQKSAMDKAEGEEGFGYFLEPGLGKTSLIYAEILDLHMQGLIDVAIGIAPNSILTNWEEEAGFCGFTGSNFNYHNLKKYDNPIPLLTANNVKLPVIMMNFESIITPSGIDFLDKIIKHYGKQRVYFFVDESSRIKNHTSKRSKEILYWGHRVAYKRAATGSAVTRDPSDLYPQMQFIGATNMLFYAFRNRFCQMGGFKGKKIVGVRNEEQLTALLSAKTFLGLKADWTDLPEQIYETRHVPMSDRQTRAYREMAEDFLSIIDGQEFEANMAITQLSKLQQIACGFIKDGETELDLCHNLNYRIEETKNILEEVTGKTLIFVWHRWCVDKLSKELAQYNPAILKGGMKREDFDGQKAKFNKDPTCRIGIIQIASGGIGLTLLGDQSQTLAGDHDNLGDACNTTIYFENSFDLEHRIQTEGRNHRHGQKNCVTYYDFISSPIDQKVVKALKDKFMMVKTILNPEYWHELKGLLARVH